MLACTVWAWHFISGEGCSWVQYRRPTCCLPSMSGWLMTSCCLWRLMLLCGVMFLWRFSMQWVNCFCYIFEIFLWAHYAHNRQHYGRKALWAYPNIQHGVGLAIESINILMMAVHTQKCFGCRICYFLCMWIILFMFSDEDMPAKENILLIEVTWVM